MEKMNSDLGSIIREVLKGGSIALVTAFLFLEALFPALGTLLEFTCFLFKFYFMLVLVLQSSLDVLGSTKSPGQWGRSS